MNALGAFAVQDSNLGKKRNTDFEAIREMWGLAAAANPKMRAIDLRVVMVLQSYLSRKDFTAFPGIPTIGKQIGKAARTVQRSIHHIEELGHLKIERRWDAGRHCWQSNRYHPQIPMDALNETLQERYAVTLQKMSPPPGVDLSPPSRRGNVVITSDLTSDLTSLTTCHADAWLSSEDSEDQEKGNGPSGRERNGASPRREPAKPYSLEDVELLQEALNDSDKTYAGIIAATE
jgi:hypothetical protein